MAALNLLPSRVAFVDAQGRLTPEAYRSLMALYDRVGGAFGDQGIDVFGNVISAASDQTIQAEIVTQPIAPDIEFADAHQPTSEQNHDAEMVFQPPVLGSAIQAITPGASPYTYRTQQEGTLSVVGGTMSALSLTRSGVSVSLAVSTPMIPLSPGDTVTITYTVAPTLKLIPR